jgi:hypothetical protein
MEAEAQSSVIGPSCLPFSQQQATILTVAISEPDMVYN